TGHILISPPPGRGCSNTGSGARPVGSLLGKRPPSRPGALERSPASITPRLSWAAIRPARNALTSTRRRIGLAHLARRNWRSNAGECARRAFDRLRDTAKVTQRHSPACALTRLIGRSLRHG